MHDTCPRCKSDKIIDELKAARKFAQHYGCGTPELMVASSLFKFTCANCGFIWGPAEGLLQEAKVLEDKYWRSIESILKLKKAERPEWDFSGIERKIASKNPLAPSQLASLEIEPERSISHTPLRDIIPSYVEARNYYRNRLNEIRKGVDADTDENSLHCIFKKRATIAEAWEKMSKEEKVAAYGFSIDKMSENISKARELREIAEKVQDLNLAPPSLNNI